MKTLNLKQFDQIVKTTHMKPRFKRDLKYVASAESLNNTGWEDLELLAIWNKSQKGGLLLIQPSQDLYLVPFELGAGNSDSSGRSKPVVCDLCFTWRNSGDAGYITFYPDSRSNNSISFLSCFDLKCSDHVRTKTAVGIKSRAQLRENLDDNSRVERLKQRLQGLVETLELRSVEH